MYSIQGLAMFPDQEHRSYIGLNPSVRERTISDSVAHIRFQKTGINHGVHKNCDCSLYSVGPVPEFKFAK